MTYQINYGTLTPEYPFKAEGQESFKKDTISNEVEGEKNCAQSFAFCQNLLVILLQTRCS